jgi:hypothetical protein
VLGLRNGEATTVPARFGTRRHGLLQSFDGPQYDLAGLLFDMAVPTCGTQRYHFIDARRRPKHVRRSVSGGLC